MADVPVPITLSDKRRVAWAALGIFSGALLVRFTIFHLGEYSALIGDEAAYWYHATEMTYGIYTHRVFLPGWPYLLSLLLSVRDSLPAARLLVVVIGSSSAIFVYLIGRREFSPRVGWIAALLFVGSPDQAFTSHYLYAEIVLEWLLLALTYAFVMQKIRYSSWERMLFLSFLFGCALLFKHFILLVFLSFLAALVRNRSLSPKRSLALLVFFLIPPSVLALRLASTGRDPLMPLNAAMISISNWQVDTIAGDPDYRQKTRFFTGHFKSFFRKGARYAWKRIVGSVLRLWGADSYPQARLRWGKYASWIPVRGVSLYFLTFYFVVMVFGLVGIAQANNQPFKTFTVMNLLLLSLLSLSFLMVARYRLPYMSFFILYAASVMSEFSKTVRSIRLMTWPRQAGWGALILLFGWIFAATWPL